MPLLKVQGCTTYGVKHFVSQSLSRISPPSSQPFPLHQESLDDLPSQLSMPPIPIQDDDELMDLLEGVFEFLNLYTSNKDVSRKFLVGEIWTKGEVARGLLLGFSRHWHTTTPRNHKMLHRSHTVSRCLPKLLVVA